ncbi:NUDIX domain-containing protein [Nocardioides alpinus]|uniref:NUDIX domain-containing protein n=1 Tax=Nocardioides alpinus TaxID=748909 RepID=A0A1I0YCM9_9ACTN|nr:NUDIX domain-containing protein [Nocardioides alpinus]PKH38929.1 NUDIX domain-containing protein [Nocardioides alpinus]SFB10557.1 NUDIX domain-containing protein [Nocardioides alpinus]
MSVDRSVIRVKAMLVALGPDGTRHAVSRNPPTRENPDGYHRLVGGSVELGETHRAAIEREVGEELGATIDDLTFLAAVESIFQINGVLGHEIVFLYSGRLDPQPVSSGATLTESDGSVVPVVWLPLNDADPVLPLYPAAVAPWITGLPGRAWAPPPG